MSVRKLRALAAAVAVLAILVFLNVSQMDDESESVFRESSIRVDNVGQVLRQHRDETISNAVSEGMSLVIASLGITVAIAGDRLRPRALRPKA